MRMYMYGRSGDPPMRMYLLDVFLNTSGDATGNPEDNFTFVWRHLQFRRPCRPVL